MGLTLDELEKIKISVRTPVTGCTCSFCKKSNESLSLIKREMDWIKLGKDLNKELSKQDNAGVEMKDGH